MSLETRVETGQISSASDLEYFGVFYPCRDLYFAFHYMDDESPSTRNQDRLIHYFSLSLLKRFIHDVEILCDEFDYDLPERSIDLLEEELSNNLREYNSPPAGTDTLDHVTSVLDKEKSQINAILRRGESGYNQPEQLMGIDTLPKMCKEFMQSISWLRDVPTFFLIDDYSLPKITVGIQSTLNNLIMERWDQVYFKISTESITSFHPYDRSGKLLEESREFEVVDLASHFISDTQKRGKFLKEVLNTRLETTSGVHEDYNDIYDILHERPYPSYNELARRIRSESDVHYAGFETLRDMFSGDISEMLRLVRGMFSEVGQQQEWEEGNIDLPIPPEKQNEVIRRYGGRFLNQIESVPGNGEQLRQIAEELGRKSNLMLLEQDSKNETGSPPFQSFRIELRDSFSFDSGPHLDEVARALRRDTASRPDQDEVADKAKTIYDELLQYGIFLLDTRGKSIRGGAVPRLYLRRLLIPKFNLTPSQRDNISMEPAEFLYLLINPAGYDSSDFERPEDESILSYNEDSGNDS